MKWLSRLRRWLSLPPQVSPGDIEITLYINAETAARIERIRERTGVDSKIEVIRRALAHYDVLCQQWEDGGRVFVRSSRGEREIKLHIGGKEQR